MEKENIEAELERQKIVEQKKEEEQVRETNEKKEKLMQRRKEVENKLLENRKDFDTLLHLKCHLDNELHLSFTTDTQQQTDITSSDLDNLIKENQFLKDKLKSQLFQMSLIADNDKHSNFYTGISWQVVNHLFQFLSPSVHCSRALKKDEFLWFLYGSV